MKLSKFNRLNSNMYTFFAFYSFQWIAYALRFWFNTFKLIDLLNEKSHKIWHWMALIYFILKLLWNVEGSNQITCTSYRACISFICYKKIHNKIKHVHMNTSIVAYHCFRISFERYSVFCWNDNISCSFPQK